MSTTVDFPLIYCNGDSYSDENYHATLKNKIYANAVADYCNGFVINKSISGSCNRRIVRTTLHDVIHQRRINPTQQIIVLIGLSFELRSEIWVDKTKPNLPEESNFKTHIFSENLTWREDLLNSIGMNTQNPYELDKKFFNHYSKGRAYFFSPYAERINLLTDLVMLKSTFDSLNIDFLIFQSPKAEKLESDHLLDFLKQEINSDTRFFDFENFGFCDWSSEQGFIPLDYLDRPTIGHYGTEAHQAFANNVLIPKLHELNIL